MQARDVEVVRESFRRWEEGGFEDIATFWHEDCRITSPEGWPEQGPFSGREAVVGQFKRLAAEFDERRLEITSILEKDDWVIVDFVFRVRGTGSGIENRAEMAAAFRLEDGRYREGHYRWTHGEALEAAGLSEEKS